MVLGWDFALDFMLFIIYLVLKFSDLSPSLPHVYLACFLVKPKTGEEGKKLFLKQNRKLILLLYQNGKEKSNPSQWFFICK